MKKLLIAFYSVLNFKNKGDKMKKVFLAILMLAFLVIPALADVTAEIIKCDLDASGNLRVYTQYKIDGVEVPSNYPQFEGKYYYVTSYNFKRSDILADDILTKIKKDIEAYAQSLLARTYISKQNAEIVKSKLANIVGQKVTISSVVIQDGTKELEVNTAGQILKETISAESVK